MCQSARDLSRISARRHVEHVQSIQKALHGGLTGAAPRFLSSSDTQASCIFDRTGAARCSWIGSRALLRRRDAYAGAGGRSFPYYCAIGPFHLPLARRNFRCRVCLLVTALTAHVTRRLLAQANARQWLDSLLLAPLPEHVGLPEALQNGMLLRRVTKALLDSRKSDDGAVPRVKFDSVKDLEPRKPAHMVCERIAPPGAQSAAQGARSLPWSLRDSWFPSTGAQARVSEALRRRPSLASAGCR